MLLSDAIKLISSMTTNSFFTEVQKEALKMAEKALKEKRRIIVVKLELEGYTDVELDQIENDLMQEINCCSHRFGLISVYEMKGEEDV